MGSGQKTEGIFRFSERGIRIKNLFIKGLPDDLSKAMKVMAAEKDMKIRELVIAAILAYLTAERGK